MKTELIFLLSIIVLLVSCEPNCKFYIRNNSNSDLFLKTRPSIESLYLKESGYYDSILAYKIGEEKGLSIYQVKPHQSFSLYQQLGVKPSITELPFDHIELLQDRDTVVLDTNRKYLTD